MNRLHSRVPKHLGAEKYNNIFTDIYNVNDQILKPFINVGGGCPSSYLDLVK